MISFLDEIVRQGFDGIAFIKDFHKQDLYRKRDCDEATVILNCGT